MHPIVIMGVSGCGKTTVGQLVSRILSIPFFDADDFHPEANKQKMASGTPLNDQDRAPWLEDLSDLLAKNKGGMVLACSALKEDYRQILSAGITLNWIILHTEFEVIAERLNIRQDHFFDPSLLQSQFDTLESPDYGLQLDASQDPKILASQVAAACNHMGISDFGLIGLGVMGSNLALNLIDQGIQLSVYNRFSTDEAMVVPNFLKDQSLSQVLGFNQLESFVRSLRTPRKILIMVPAGKAIDSVLEAITPLLQPGDALIDGGNAHYKETSRRAQLMQGKSIAWMGCGVSGGREGARKGPSLMLGGDAGSAPGILKILAQIAAIDKAGAPCISFLGEGGAGHFVKMVHNGMEYAEMQLLAEVFDLLRPSLSYVEIEALFTKWNSGDSQSYLLGITSDILRTNSGNGYELDRIVDVAGSKGTGTWSAAAALELGIPATLLSSAVYARAISTFQDSRRSAEVSKQDLVKWDEETLEQLHSAYSFVRLINHIQGFQLINEACEQFQWTADLSEIARIWTEGCIIKSKLMEACQGWLAETSELVSNPRIRQELSNWEPDVAQCCQWGLQQRTPLSVINGAFNWWLAMNQADSPAKLIQAQRDYFGQHGYFRTDDPQRKVSFKWERTNGH
ncbi:NADP-dependent phosphogluconate dehydrogenase [Aureitalea marina]|uniref:6-phosphogluconate dehydrogenase, decarboxylating n=1 Tax=Aureitalea marina TaxID=930804 RepID=A0A2S7KP35_9FLAO|nr:NADP-dependent phosphogluconate dehydrogenase [Aureitalea marina]PQB04389.1 phosphogluconate dehydrogenase (NADP(+)-dependent, decarboxylating) [Aureitalea marina]